MDEFVCLTVVGRPGEPAAAFAARLTAFWTHLLRTRPADYERVFAEEKGFEDEGGAVARRYMVEPDAAPALTAALAANGLAFAPVDADDRYSKAEASASEWFQIEH